MKVMKEGTETVFFLKSLVPPVGALAKIGRL